MKPKSIVQKEQLRKIQSRLITLMDQLLNGELTADELRGDLVDITNLSSIGLDSPTRLLNDIGTLQQQLIDFER